MSLVVINILFFCQQNIIYSQYRDFTPKEAIVTPTAYQFIKYGEIPVSEYTGVPNISIPIYTLTAGEKQFPLNLTYLASGVKVADEASWVGLGWSLSVGNITQIINDRDDLGNYTKLIPDYYSSYGTIYWLPQTYPKYPFLVEKNPCPISYPMTKSNPDHSYAGYTDSYVPINGEYYRNVLFFSSNGQANDKIDSEPDVFKANFFDHSIEFIEDFSTGLYSVLNKSNYKITRSASTGKIATWTIIAPDGVTYFFDEINEIPNGPSTHSDNGDGASGETNSMQPSTRTWHLTKIITPQNQLINFEYELSDAMNNFPSFTQFERYVKFVNTYHWTPNAGSYSQNITDGSVYSLTPEIQKYNGYDLYFAGSYKLSYLKSIVFPKGRISFIKSFRDDNIGDKKLDKIIVKNSNDLIVKQIDFAYTYFVGEGKVRNFSYPIGYTQKTSNEQFYRLKLNSLSILGENPYRFVYNNTVLPSKTSNATDYWGYYNGKEDNVSLVPNPMDIGEAEFGDNGNDHKPYLSSAKAGQLEEIIYPTGGRSVFDYEFHEFNNKGSYHNKSINKGFGLRVKSITNWINQDLINKKIYSYSEGTLMAPFICSREKDITTLFGQNFSLFNTTSISANNYFSCSMLGSGQHVGYKYVTSEILDRAEKCFGKTTSYFHCNPDKSIFFEQVDWSLPPCKANQEPLNGLLMKQIIFSSVGDTIQTIENYYKNKMSNLYYGAKPGAYGKWVLFLASPFTGDDGYYELSRNIIGFYPLYGMQSFIDYSETTDYTSTGKIYTKSSYTYSSNDLLKSITTKNNYGETVSNTSTYPTDYTNAEYAVLRSKNMLDHPIGKAKWVNGVCKYYMKENYNGVNVSKVIESSDGSSIGMRDRINYEYDANSNVIKYDKCDGVYNSLIWGYNNTLPTALFTNESYITHCAYSSFELPFQSTNSGFTDGGWKAATGPTWLIKSGIAQVKEGSNCLANANSDNGYLESTGLMQIGKYKISFYTQALNTDIPSSIILSGSSGITGTITNNTDGSWKLVELEMNITTPNTYTTRVAINNAKIDRLLLYPSTAQSTTYSHIPLVGITSQTDPNGLMTTYEYDTYNRLVRIKDYANNIIKEFGYSIEESANFNGFELMNLSYTGISNVRVSIGLSKNYTLSLPSWMTLISKDERGFNVAISSNYSDVVRSGTVFLTEPKGITTVLATQEFCSFELKSSRYYTVTANGGSTELGYLVCSSVNSTQQYLHTWVSSPGKVDIYLCSSNNPNIEILLQSKNSLEGYCGGSFPNICSLISGLPSGSMFFRFKKYNLSGVKTNTIDTPSFMYAGY